MGKDYAERFWSKVALQGPEQCWDWQAGTSRGYGMFHLDGKTRPAHRVAYELFREPIPSGLTIDHLCRNRRCVNPNHMECVTHAENTRRGDGGAWQRAKTHCPRGHVYDELNTGYRRGGKSRYCRTCDRARSAKAYARRRSV